MSASPKNSRGEIPLSWFARTLWKFTPLYVEILFIAICLRLIGLVEPFIFQVIIDRILPFQRDASLLVVVAVFVAVSIFQMGFEVLSQLLGMLTAKNVTHELGARIFSHLFKLPFRYFRHWSVGESMARIGETSTINRFLVGTTTGVLLDLIFVFVYIGVLYSLSEKLTTIILIALPVQILIYMAFGPFLRRRLRAQFDAGAAHQSQMIESISGIASVKALSIETSTLDRLDGTLSESLNAGYRTGILQIWNSKLLFIVEQTVKIGIIYFGATSVFSGQMTLGELIAFHLLAEKVSGPIQGFAGLWESWQNVRVSRQRLGDVVNSPVEKFGVLPLLPRPVTGHLRFNQVNFGYIDDSPLLSNFNFVALPCSLSLVVGPSGSGKSTFGRLAAGIDVPHSGEVFLDGSNIAAHDPHDVRSRIAYVPQEPYLFSGSVRENLVLGNEMLNDEIVARAMRISGFNRLVAQLPAGLDTEVGERGSELSGGQRQRVAIARSLLRSPNVIILDEPTSALDALARDLMILELEKLRREVTLIIITHNPGIFKSPDRVLDFESR